MNQEELRKYVSDGVDRAKAGQAVAIYKEVAPRHDNGQLDQRSHYGFAWVIYYAMHQSASVEIPMRKRMLARYLKLNTPRPHKLHSMMLTEAIRLYKDARDVSTAMRLKGDKPSPDMEFSLVKFMALWNFANLREGDWRRKQHEGKQLNATVEKLITHYVDELQQRKLTPPADFMTVMERGVKEFGDSCNILAQRAALYLMAGEREKGVELLRQAVLTAPGKYYLWQRLADALPDDAPMRLRVALLHKALSAPGPEMFKGRVRLAMADAWLTVAHPAYAAWELEAVKRLYESNGWHMPRLFSQLANLLPAAVVAQDPSAVYRKIGRIAEEYLYEALPSIRTKKNYHKEATPGVDRYGRARAGEIAWRVVDADGRTYWFNPGRHGIREDLPHGTEIDIRLHNGKIVKATLPEDS